jgi:hypothetical protein
MCCTAAPSGRGARMFKQNRALVTSTPTGVDILDV